MNHKVYYTAHWETLHILTYYIVFVISANMPLIHFVVGTYSLCSIDIFASIFFILYYKQLIGKLIKNNNDWIFLERKRNLTQESGVKCYYK